MAEKDARAAVGRHLQQGEHDVQWEKVFDAAVVSLGANDIAQFMVAPKGFVLDRADVFVITPQGGAATVDIGTKTTSKLFVDAGDANGAANSRMALGAGAVAAAGYLFTADTPLYVKALAAINKAKFKVVLRGYLTQL